MWIYKLIHPLVLKMLGSQQGHHLHIMGDKTNCDGIYLANHSSKWDFPIAASAIVRHVYVLIGKQPLNILDRIGFCINGAIWVDRKKSDSRKKCYGKMKSLLLKSGNSILIFPEGTWNLLPSTPMLPIYWGAIGLAMETGKPIIPLAMEYRDKQCYVLFGQPIYLQKNDNKKERADEVRDVLATLCWNIWDSLPHYKRSDIKPDEWDKEIEKRLKEYPKLKYEYEKSVIRTEHK